MSRFVQPVALWLLVALGALPAASLACQALCAPAAGHEHHPAAHDHAPAAPETSAPSPDGPAIGSPSQRCDHTGLAAVAVVSDGTKLSPPVVVVVSRIAFGDSPRTTCVIVASASHSPPGTPPGPRSLRI